MNYFIKAIDDVKDPAITRKWIDPGFLPFTIVAFDGWRGQPSSAEIRVLVRVMFMLLGDDSALSICRLTTERRDAFVEECNRRFEPVALEVKGGWLRHCRSHVAYRVDEDGREEFARILAEYWVTTLAGNWLVWENRQTSESKYEVRRVFAELGRNPAKLHYRLLSTCGFVGITFDDQLLDCFVKRDADHVERILHDAAQQYGVQLTT